MSNIPRAFVRQLANKIRDCGKQPRFAFLLGAGASRQSEIITAPEMIRIFKERIFAEWGPGIAKTDLEKEDWLRSQDWYKNGKSEYSALFEKFEAKEIGRQRYIEGIIEGREPSFGYMVLANLMASGYINTVITTNFDDLVYGACTGFTSIRPIVYAYGVLASEMRIAAQRPKILKLHGDYLYSAINNTSSETARLEANMARQLTQVLAEYGLVVIGYGGADDSVMDILSNISAKNDLYWCILRGTEPSARVKELLTAKSAFVVEIDGFDEMMNEIRHVVGFDVGKMIGWSRQDQMIEKIKYFAPSYAIGILNEISEALRKQALAGEQQIERIEALRFFTSALEAHEKGELTKAERLYRKAIKHDPTDAYTYNNLGTVLAEEPSRQRKAEQAYRKAIELNPNSAIAHFNLANLLDGDQRKSEEVIKAYTRAIELSPNLIDAYHNLLLLRRLQNRADEARVLAEKLLQLDPQSVDALLALASIHKKQRHNRKTLEYVSRARRLIEPNNWYYLACVESIAGKAVLALKYLSKASHADSFDAAWAKRDPDLSWIADEQQFGRILRLTGRPRAPRKSNRKKGAVKQGRRYKP